MKQTRKCTPRCGVGLNREQGSFIKLSEMPALEYTVFSSIKCWTSPAIHYNLLLEKETPVIFTPMLRVPKERGGGGGGQRPAIP